MPDHVERFCRVVEATADPASYPIIKSYLSDKLVSPAELLRSMTPAASTSPDELSDAGHDTGPGGIPRIVFQTWKSRTIIPDNYTYWRSTFIRNNPGYKVLLWDDDDNFRFIAARHAWFLPQYQAYSREIFRADVIRFFFLYEYGGFYADMDSECLRPLDDMRVSGDIVLGRMGRNFDFPHAVPNALMASRPHQAFWLLAIVLCIEGFERARTQNNLETIGPEWLTGPILLKQAAEFYQKTSPGEIEQRISRIKPYFDKDTCRFGELQILEPRYLYPVNWHNPFHKLFRWKMFRQRRVLGPQAARALFPDAHMVTYWSRSW